MKQELTNMQLQLEAKNKEIELLMEINKRLECTTVQVDAFLNQVTSVFTDPTTGRWITLKWYDVALISKGLSMLFTFVKTTLKTCYGIEFLPRIPSWLQFIFN